MPGSVLIIDADEEFAGRLKSTLESFGARVEVTGDGRAGLDMARINVPDAIVVCVELPRMSGYSICAKLKKDPTLKTVSLVITSAEATQETFEHHKKLKNRAEEYLRKPFTPESLVETLRPYIELEAVPTTPPPAIDDPVLMADATSVFEGEHFHFEQVPDAVEASVAVETIQPPVVPDIHPSIPEPLSDGYEEDEAMTTIGVVPPAGSEVLFKEIEQLRTELEAEREAHAQTVRERDSAVAGERAVTQQLQSVSSGSPSQLSASRDVLSIKKELHDRDKQILELRDAVQQKERELLAQRDKEMELEGRLVQTQEDLEESGRKVSGLQQQVAEFEARVSELNARFEQSEADAAEARSELDAEIGRLKAEIEESYQKIGAHEEEITSLRTTNQALTGEVTRMNNEVSATLAESSALRDELQSAQLQSSQLDSDLQTVRDQAENAQNALEATKASLEETEEQAARAFERIRHDGETRTKVRQALDIALRLLTEPGEENGVDETIASATTTEEIRS